MTRAEATWYEVSHGNIKPVQVSRVTSQSVYTVDDDGRERRNAMRSQWGEYYPTLQEAVAAAVWQYEGDIRRYRHYIDTATNKLEQLQQEYPAEYAQAHEQEAA